MESFLHFEEDVLEDQPVFLVSFALQGSLWWDLAKQIREQAKTCSGIKGLYSATCLHWFSQDLKFLSAHGHCTQSFDWYSYRQPVFPYLLVEDPAGNLMYHLCQKTLLSGLQKTLQLLTHHHATLPADTGVVKDPCQRTWAWNPEAAFCWSKKALSTSYSCWGSL